MAYLNFNPPVIAHRGASAYAPENTMAAFTKAAQVGVKWIELDIMQTIDDELIVFHDETLNRTTDGHGIISQFSLPYLQTLDAGAWFHPKFASERIPSLKQVMEFLQNTKLSANIEIKALTGQGNRMIKKLLDEFPHYFNNSNINILFSSFSIEILNLLRKDAPNVYIGLLLHKWKPRWQAIADSLQCISVHVNHKILTPKAANEIKNSGRLLLCYTVNDPKRALQLFEWGADAVFSDMPDKILAALKK